MEDKLEDIVELHKLDVAVDAFSAAMKMKLHRKLTQDRYQGWDAPEYVASGEAQENLLAHAKDINADMVDVANFAMMIWHQKQVIGRP